MKETLLAVGSIGVVQAVGEMPLPDILKSIVSIVVGVGYILENVRKLRIRRKAKRHVRNRIKSN